MKKVIIIITSSFILLLVAFGLYLVFFKSKSVSKNNTGSYQQIKPLPIPAKPTGSQFSIPTEAGNIMVNNFFNSNPKIIETAVYLKDTQNYVIIYNSNTNQFLIALYGRSLNENDTFRQDAEADFIKILGVSQNDACNLPVDLEVLNSYDSYLSGTNYNLSFCPNGIAFPEQPNTNNSTGTSTLQTR